MKWFALALVMLVASPRVFAQEAPTGGHYAGRPSDTGFGGTHVNATGAFPAAVPLDLPAARGGLPIPLQIVYGGRGCGAAGLGWDIPLSYVQRDRTLAHRRPENRLDSCRSKAAAVLKSTSSASPTTSTPPRGA